MRSSWYFLLVFFVNSMAYALSPAEELTNILNGMKSLRADFAQKLLTDTEHVLQQSHGHMTILKPGLFKWQVLGADEMLIIVNQHEIINYDKILEQVTIQKVGKQSVNLPISGLLSGTENIAQNFRVSKSSECKNTKQCFLLKPQSSEADFTQAILGFNDNKLTLFKLLDNLGQVSVFEFNNIKLNVAIQPSEFKFKIPPHVDIIKSE